MCFQYNSTQCLLKFVLCVILIKVLVTQLCLTLCDPIDCSPPNSSVHGFFKQEYWSGLSFPSPGDLPNPGTEPGSPTFQANSLPYDPSGSCQLNVTNNLNQMKNLTFKLYRHKKFSFLKYFNLYAFLWPLSRY